MTFAPMTNIPVPLSTHRFDMNVETSFCFLLSSILCSSTYFLFRIYERDWRRLCGAGGHEAGHTAGDEEGDRQGQARDH